MSIQPTPNNPVSRLLSSTAIQIVSAMVVVGFLGVVCFSLVWDEIHGTPLTSTSAGLLNFLLTFISLVTGIHVGSGVTSAAANQGITAVINPASLTVDSAGRSNGVNDNIRTAQSSTMSGGPQVRQGASAIAQTGEEEVPSVAIARPESSLNASGGHI